MAALSSTDLEVLSTLLTWQVLGHGAALATVVRTYGSSPRPVGSLAAIRTDGTVVGSVSGGCVEQDLIERVIQALPTLPQRLNYGGKAVGKQRWELPCGGEMEIVLECAPCADLLEQMLGAITAHRSIARRLDLARGESHLFVPSPTTHTRCDTQYLIACYGPQLRLLIIGATQTARFLGEMALALDYSVQICDPREEYRNTWNVHGCTLLAGMPDDVVISVQPDAGTAVVALTHDPKLDDMALLEALRGAAFYIGALGSQRNHQQRRERLKILNLSPHEIARLRGPVGLPIGSHTPPEIAVAILADLIAVRNGRELVTRRDHLNANRTPT